MRLISLFSIFLLIILTSLELPKCQGSRILGIFPLNGRSHMVMFEALMKGLARRGHQVDVVSTFPQKRPFPNYTDIVIPAALPKLVNNMSYQFLESVSTKSMVHFVATSAGNLVCEKGLETPELQKLIKNPPQQPPYDLVLTEIFGAHCFMAFGRHLNVPVIGLSSSALYPWGNEMIANPPNLAFIPNNMLPFMENMSFWDRLYNVVHHYWSVITFNYYASPQDEIVKRHFGSNMPGVRQLQHELALILANSHMSLNGVKPTTPALVEVGGLHIQNDDPEIPADHKKWLDESTDGFIYFTFGSMVMIETFPKSYLDILYKSLGKIAPVRVFMKVPHPELLPPGLPKNIRTFSWMPQLKVLQHKNIRAFITHGGLMGTQEAIYTAVPMIGMPLFADQFLNIDVYVQKKIAVRLDYEGLTEEKFDAALHEILTNPLYRDTIKVFSNRFLDRPLSPIDTACYWVEYVIRHGNKALRSPALDFSWWQVALLDVYVTLLIAATLAAFIAIILMQFLLHRLFNRSSLPYSKKISIKMSVSLFMLFVCISIFPTESYRVLGIFPFQSRSHQMMFDAIAKGLVKRGHQIDVMTVYPLKKPIPNYHVIVNLENMTESLVNKWDVKFASELGDDTLPIIALPFGNGLCELLGLPEMQQIIKKPPQDPPYDLVIVESFGANCFVGLGYALKIPVIMASSTIDLPWLDKSIGQPINTAFFPAFFTGHSHPMSFFQRLHNTVKGHTNIFRFERYTDEVQNSLMRKYISPDIPPLHELEKNISLALVNSFHSLNGVRPLVPKLIEVAGLHVEEHFEEMPQDLEKWMNESTAGVIYFTLGSMVNIETFTNEVMRAFYSAFSKLAPIRVLMKVANKDKLLPGLPKNVRTSSWIPQIAVFAHKNTKVFITHGGLMGTQEALTYGVPIVGIPLFGDQFSNIEHYMAKNMALKLDNKNLTEESIYTTLKEILNNPKYSEAAKYEAARFRDRPLSAMETAMYWIEYAIRNDPSALKSPAVDMPWWQVALLDVYGFLLICIIILSYLIFLILRACAAVLFFTSAKRHHKVAKSRLEIIFLDDLCGHYLKMRSLNCAIAIIVAMAFYCQTSQSLRILGVFPIAGSSHFIPGGELMKALARKGHKVDVISHFPQKKPIPNYTDISLRGIAPIATNNISFESTKNFTSFSMQRFVNMAGIEVCDLLSKPVYQDFLKNTPKGMYDVVIVEMFVSHCYLALGQHLNATLVGLVVSKLHDWLYGPFGVPFNTAYIPSLFSSFSQKMTFLERLQNTFMKTIIVPQINYYMEGQIPQVEKYFGRKLSSMSELYDDVSLLLLNSHHSIYDNIPTPPGVVEIGGFHVNDDQQELPSEIKSWLDNSKDGCIYFSFGSMVRIETFPAPTLKAFYDMFERIAPVRVLLKIADPTILPHGLPKNVITSPWLPQRAVLKHKNIKLFITHGGLMGTQEALTLGVPMLGIPVFGDQHTNLAMYARRKIAIVLKHEDITSDSLTEAVTTIIHKDPSFKENSERLSKLFLDRPMSAMDTAIYWVEYVARHGSILKSPATELSWWQYYLIDVYGFFLACILIALYIIKVVMKLTCRLICSSKSCEKSPNVTKTKKNK
ncbi:uncharacterized protein [Chelonus insularis]|uniref:uncharacterized protein n=1 Tax=Chelonus insularis TaxID=460826 RepID=UPI00158C89A2|nr:uncharacterized protein LOC118072343 [Chelonus insularis]